MSAPPRHMALDMALQLAAAGYHLAPVTIRRDPSNGKKRPDYHRMSWDVAATTDPDRLTTWARQFGPNVGFLVACEPSGIIGVDLDLAGDALGWWAGESLPCSPMVVDTPSGGQHHYWRMPAGMAIPNSAGAIHAGVDLRGIGGMLFAPGTRVVGDPEPYRLADPLIPAHELPELPDEIVKRIPTARRRERVRGEHAASHKVHDEPWVIRECSRQLGLVSSHPSILGSGFRGVLMGAAMVLGRAVSANITDRDYAEQRLAEAAAECWGSVDAEDREWIATGLDDGEGDPWTVIPAPDPSVAGSSEVPDAGDDPDGYQIALALEVRKIRLRREAARRVAAEDREPLAVLGLDEFLTAPQVDYLVPGMLWRTGTSRIFGPPGETKSFLALDVALHLATGTPWRPVGDTPTAPEPVTVHYVMAEGHAVNTVRALAWFHHHQVDPAVARDTFRAIPQGVLLTPEGVAGYLELVAADRPALIVLDTKARMMLGDENTAADSAVLVRAVDALREASGGNVCLIDHTGLTDQTRARGSSAVLAAMDTEIRVSMDRELGVATAEVTRDKAAEPGTTWPYRLHRVLGVPGLRTGTPTPAVPVPAAESAGTPFRRSGTWWDLDQPEIPAEVAELTGRGHQAARDVFRVLRFVDDPDGLTIGQITAALAEGPHKHSKSAVFAGRTLLMESGAAHPSPTSVTRTVLEPRFRLVRGT